LKASPCCTMRMVTNDSSEVVYVIASEQYPPPLGGKRIMKCKPQRFKESDKKPLRKRREQTISTAAEK
jgi:hypothetical protein